MEIWQSERDDMSKLGLFGQLSFEWEDASNVGIVEGVDVGPNWWLYLRGSANVSEGGFKRYRGRDELYSFPCRKWGPPSW